MRKFCQFVLALTLILGLVTQGLSQDAKAKRLKPNAARKNQPAVQLPKGITLTDDQKAKLPQRKADAKKKPKDKKAA